MPHSIIDDEISDPTFGVPPIKDMVKQQGQLIEHFQNRWKKEYLTFLRKYNTTGTNKQQRFELEMWLLFMMTSQKTNWK